ncbi:MAG: hypothetical protein AAGH15_25210 [Myxococcota bacterium]
MAAASKADGTKKTHVRPLLFRPGAHYRCFGDGLCCTDIHGLGPITRKELVQIRAIDPAGAGWDDGFEDHMLSPAADGGCHFLLPDQRCDVHARFGPEAKPDGCRRFPLGLTATPEGGRVTTFHRCPCRTLGDRPALAEDDVLPSIADKRGRPKADRRAKKLRLTRKDKKSSFEAWRTLETELLSRLRAGDAPEAVLDARAFPKLAQGAWVGLGEDLIDQRDGSAFGVASAWFAEAIRLEHDPDARPRWPHRPWAEAFDRAEARSPTERPVDAMLADWIADEIWSLSWTEHTSFDVKRAELATRLMLARRITGALTERGCRADRACAEALMVVELIGESEHWTDLLPAMRPGK